MFDSIDLKKELIKVRSNSRPSKVELMNSPLRHVKKELETQFHFGHLLHSLMCNGEKWWKHHHHAAHKNF